MCEYCSRNCTGHRKTLSLLTLTWRQACVLTTRLKTAKTGNVTVACVEVIGGLTAEPFMHFECWLKVYRVLATNRAECRIWASRSTNHLWSVDKQFAGTACSIWCGSVLLDWELNLCPFTDNTFPATFIAILVTSRSTSLSSLLPQLGTSHHTVCYVANGLYFITEAAEIVARSVKTAELLLSVRQAPLCTENKYTVWSYEGSVHVILPRCVYSMAGI
jgi:hypothetical protein